MLLLASVTFFLKCLLLVSYVCYLIFTPSFPLRRAAGTSVPGGLEIPYGFKQPLIALSSTPRQDQVRLAIKSCYLLLGWLLSWFTQQDSPCWSFLGHSRHMSEPKELETLDSEKQLDIQGFTIFTVVHFAAKCHTVNSSQKSISAACTWDSMLSVIAQDSWP